MSTRREFIRQAALATAALGAGSLFKAEGMSRTKGKVIGANDVIRVGVVGVNSRGLALASSFAKMPLCEVTCICDCCLGQIETQTGKRPKGFADIRKFMESRDFDACVIAMPDHWHAKAAIMALQAGKHVYLEKPSSYCPSENYRILEEAAKHPELVITAGNQRRSWPNIIAAIDEVRGGSIGRVRYAKSWYTANRPSIGRGKAIPVPAELDWDLWQTQELRRRVLSGEGICLASDADMELYEVAGDYTETPAAHGRMALYRDRMEIDSLCMPLSDISGMSVIGPQALIFTCRGTSYTVRSKAVRNMRKYLTLYEILKTNSFIA